MLLTLITFLRLLSLGPLEATAAGATWAGSPDFARELTAICRRESPGSDCSRRVGVHSNNTPAVIRRFWSKARARGWIDPEHCPAHRVPPREFSVRGNHGQAAAYSLRFVGGCQPPSILDNPFISAVAATRRAQAMCMRWGACDRVTRNKFWYGAASYARRTRRLSEAAQADRQPRSNPTEPR